MKLENYEVHLPSYSIGDKIYEKIGPGVRVLWQKGTGHRGAQGLGCRL